MSTRMWLFALMFSGCALVTEGGSIKDELGLDGLDTGAGDDDDDDDNSGDDDDDDNAGDDDDDDNAGDDDDDDDDDDSGLAACAGSYSGTYDGSDSGVAAATLAADGALEVTFTSSVGEVNSDGTVTESGDVSGEDGNISITGEWDFENCRGSGTWYSFDIPAGSWELQRE